jgi:hypothetical protein
MMLISLRNGLANLLVVCGHLSGLAYAECELSGKVKDGSLPLANASVVMLLRSAEIATAQTIADGSYRLVYPELPSELRSAVVTVNASSYSEDHRILFRERRGKCLEISTNDVVLEAMAGAPTDFSSLGQTIFVSSYVLYGSDTESISARFNQDLPNIVHHKILVYKSSLSRTTSSIDISVDSLNETVTPAEGERIFRLGHQLNALGVIAGDGELVNDPSGAQQLRLTSVFRTIPIYRNIRSSVQPITDHIPAGSASPSRIATGLQDHWGKQALLSFVLQRLAAHEGQWQTEELDRLSDILIDVRNTMQITDRLLDLTNELLEVIEAERSS